MGSLLHFLRPEMASGDTDFVYREAREYSCGAWGDRQGGGQHPRDGILEMGIQLKKITMKGNDG